MSSSGKLSREDFRKQKLIEEQRKAGTLPAEIDPETGRDINPHIPQYISKAPWYLDIHHTTLKHQRFVGDASSIDKEWYARGARQGPAATKYRKGACENCGAMTHKTKECMERPRKKGARWTGADIQADEVVQTVDLGFEAKRDRWNGYDAGEYQKLAEDWEVVEAKRREIRERETREKLAAAAKASALAAKAAAEAEERAAVAAEAAAAAAAAAAASGAETDAAATGGGSASASPSRKDAASSKGKRAVLVGANGKVDSKAVAAAAEEAAKAKAKAEAAAKAAAEAAAELEDSSDNEDDEDKYAEGADVVGQKVDTKTRITVRNLRIREDTAKYLRNLDVNSAHYDPKTRSMRQNPYGEKVPENATYTGDNAIRMSGDIGRVAQLQMFAWQAEGRGKDMHMQANPTQAEFLYKEYLSKKGEIAESQRQSVLAKYGGAEHFDAPPKELLLAQTEEYVEYSQTGRLAKGQERAKVKSRYSEDLFPLNHTSVWGSWWNNGQWGYACCHATFRAAYCAGKAAIEAEESSRERMRNFAENGQDGDDVGDTQHKNQKKSLLDQYVQRAIKDGGAAANATRAPGATLRKHLGEGDIELNTDKLKSAVSDERKRKAAGGEDQDGGGFGGKGKRGGKRKYNSTHDTGELTEEQLEAYRLEQQHAEDPMANYVDDESS